MKNILQNKRLPWTLINCESRSSPDSAEVTPSTNLQSLENEGKDMNQHFVLAANVYAVNTVE